jgi:hypothetical protein
MYCRYEDGTTAEFSTCANPDLDPLGPWCEVDPMKCDSFATVLKNGDKVSLWRPMWCLDGTLDAVGAGTDSCSSCRKSSTFRSPPPDAAALADTTPTL